jgi:hypothetical protein
MDGKISLVWICLLLPLCLQAQTIEEAVEQLGRNVNTVVRYQPSLLPAGREQLLLECPFASAEFKNPAKFPLPHGTVIEEISLLYTTYALAPQFDQNSLNYKRLQALFRLSPVLLNSPFIRWKQLPQTGAANSEEGKTYFHGFIITYRPSQTPRSTAKELAWLDSLYGSPVKNVRGKDNKTGVITTSRGVVVTGDRPMKMPAEIDTIVPERDTTITFYEYFQNWKFKRVVTLKAGKVDAYLKKVYTTVTPRVPDSVISASLNRNSSWTNPVLVCDVTGSMSPYLAQVLDWIILNSGKIKYFLFFNDDHSIRKGSLDLRSVSSNDARTIYDVMRSAVDGAKNPEIQENNLEAVIAAIERFPDVGEVIMIADNFSTPHDMELLPRVSRPVHVIPCGVYEVVNPAYLDIARATKGSVHITARDIDHLEDMKPNETIKILERIYQLKDGKFVILPKEN